MLKLLVVDDEPAVVDLFQSAFEKLGIQVVGAGSASQAVTAMKREQPDVAVLDVLLPDGSGLGVCHWQSWNTVWKRWSLNWKI